MSSWFYLNNNKNLPPNQREIKKILRWNIDHPGIIAENPKFDEKKWTLTIDGVVENPLVLKWHDLLQLKAVESVSDFHCVEGWSVRDQKWKGLRFSTIIELVKPLKNSKYVLFECSDGYTTSLGLDDLLKDNVLLAYGLNDKVLEESLGGPLRLIVPDKYAYKSAMWIRQIIFSKVKNPGFWESRGYSDSANVWKNDRFR